MARVHYRKARKDYPKQGISKGDHYYFAQIKTGPRSSRTIRQLQPIKQSQLTSSAFKSAILQAEEEWDEALKGAEHDKSGLPDVAYEIASSIREAGEEANASFENMPEGLQQGETGQMLEARYTSCEETADTIEQAGEEIRNSLDEISQIEEPEEPEDPDDEEASAQYDEDMIEYEDALAELEGRIGEYIEEITSVVQDPLDAY